MRENTERFEGLAETYALHRPYYPVEGFARLAQACKANKRLAVDIGAGPGNSTAGLRKVLGDDWLITAVEPGRDMRRVCARRFGQDPHVQVIDACAERIPLPAASAAILVACTAFHWFDRDRFFAEAARVLAPGGVLGLLRNRRRATAVLAEFDAYIATRSAALQDYAARERRKEPSVRELASLPGFRAARSCTLPWTETRDCRGLIDLYLTRSTTWAIVRRIGLGPVMEDLQAICARHAADHITLEWETTVKWVQRRG